MQGVLHYSNIEHQITMAYHHQPNRLTKRLNKMIGDILSMCVDVEHKMRDKVLPCATFAYNSAILETMQNTPFQLVQRRQPTTLLDALLPHAEDVKPNVDVQGYLQCAKELASLHEFIQ